MTTLTETQMRLFASAQSWSEGEVVRQLYATAKLSGVRCAVGFPDLHPGKGTPVGAAFMTEDVICPHIIGGDILRAGNRLTAQLPSCPSFLRVGPKVVGYLTQR